MISMLQIAGNRDLMIGVLTMNEINKTLYVPLYGKSKVSKQGIILEDIMTEKIWDSESFEMKGKSRSKWLTYNMAMRARIFDDWTKLHLRQNKDVLVLHIGCGLDSRCIRINVSYSNWSDGDFADVINIRKKYFTETEHYHMIAFNASNPESFHIYCSFPFTKHNIYDIIRAKEKQAAPKATFVFHAPINEQAACEAG